MQASGRGGDYADAVLRKIVLTAAPGGRPAGRSRNSPALGSL